MSHRSIAAVALAAGLAAACADIGAPTRADLYEWRKVVGTDTLSFHWPQSFLPVRIWAEDSDSLPNDADASIAQWNHVFLYHEYAAVRVDDSTTADVIVREAAPPAGDDILLSRWSLGSMAPECQATTLPNIDDTRQAHLPMHIYITARFSTALASTQACLALTLTHEIGHTLGIFAHSSNPNDIMFANPAVGRPSARDANTAEVLYHSPANVSPVPGR